MELDQMDVYDFIREDEEEPDFGPADEPVRLCDGCGEMLYTFSDNTLGIVSASGRFVHLFCEDCIGDAAGMIDEILDAAGIWHETGWADEVLSHANEEIVRREMNAPKKRTLTIQKGVRV